MKKITWPERVNMLSVHPVAATCDDVAHMAADIQSLTGADHGGHLTTTQAAKAVGLSTSTILRAIQRGQIRSRVTPGGHHRVFLSDVKDLFKIIKTKTGG